MNPIDPSYPSAHIHFAVLTTARKRWRCTWHYLPFLLIMSILLCRPLNDTIRTTSCQNCRPREFCYSESRDENPYVLDIHIFALSLTIVAYSAIYKLLIQVRTRGIKVSLALSSHLAVDGSLHPWLGYQLGPACSCSRIMAQLSPETL